MILKQYQVDAFTDRPFGGNPAAIVPLDAWLDDGLMQALAAENNLSETAYIVPEGDRFGLRWFTPASEVDLCGHATLAAAHVMFDELGYVGKQIRFVTRSGELIVVKDGEQLRMDFPASIARPMPPVPLLAEALGREPVQLLAGDDYMAVFERAEDVASLSPDMALLARLDLRGVIATAPGHGCDFVSRFFAPKYGIPEDPVTGSAHCLLTPWWAKRLGKHVLLAHQISARGGVIDCRLQGERVLLSGGAVLMMRGEVLLP